MSRIKESLDELQIMLLDEQLESLPILIYANKQDIATAMDAGEILEALELE